MQLRVDIAMALNLEVISLLKKQKLMRTVGQLIIMALTIMNVILNINRLYM